MPTTGTILVVEDSEPDRELTIRELSRFGVVNEIAIATSGLAALDYLFVGHETDVEIELPLVMMLDLRLPLVDGVDVLRRVRADLRTKALPIIVLTGSESDVDAMQCFTLRADYVLPKPLVFEEWHRIMRRMDLLEHLQWRPARTEGEASRRLAHERR